MNRRNFISTLSSGLVAATGAPALQAAAPKTSNKRMQDLRPNILVIMTDQQAPDMTSSRGNPYCHTPAMDKIEQTGMAFEKAYCPNPICVPSRASMFTGLLPHECGVTFNKSTPGVNGSCWAEQIRDAGYDTGYVGKWHIPAPLKNPGDHGFEFTAALRDNWVDFDIPAPSIDFIKQERDKPFFLVSSFVNPHDICEWARIAADIDDKLKNGDIPQPPPAEHCPPLPDNFLPSSDEPDILRTYQSHPDARTRYPTHNWADDDPRWRQYRWSYFRLIELVDRHIGRIISALEESGQAENTVIIFLSDHGDGAASHRWNQKTILYDEVARVPFVICDPRQPETHGKRENGRLINLGTDFCSTIFDFAGVKQPTDLRGRSARPSLNGRNDDSWPYVVVDTDLQTVHNQPGIATGLMLRTPRYKYIVYSEGEQREQLFDMEKDPGEMNNLALKEESADELTRHRALLEEWRREVGRQN